MTARPTLPRPAQELHPQRQFSLRSVLVTTVTIALVLGFVRSFGPDAVELAILSVVGALIWGCVLGWFSERFMETVTWSQLGGALTLCCVVSSNQVTSFQQSYWLNVGTIGGALAGFVAPGHWRQRIAWTLGLWVTFSAISIIGDQELLDLLLTLPVLAGLAFLAEIIARLQLRYRTAFDFWALGLVFAVIAGNYGAVLIWKLWYA
jgi:hypothetical protein